MGVYLYPNNTETPLKDAYIGIPNPTSIVLDKSSISLTTIGQTEQLTATIEPTISDHSITWNSDDTTVATVSTTGLVTCVTPGECTITATTVNGLTATCSVTEGWAPGANTIAYYPLTSTTTVNDSVGNYNLTNAGGASFGTYQGVNCVYFNGTTNSQLYNTSLSFPSYPTQTVSLWIYIIGTGSVYQTIYHIGTSAQTGKLGSWYNYSLNKSLSLSSWAGGYESLKSGDINGGWHLLTNVTNGSSSIQYLDGQQYQTYTNSLSSTQTGLYIGGANSATSERLKGYESELIIENKVRTAQEVADYYDQTKSLYGIS